MITTNDLKTNGSVTGTGTAVNFNEACGYKLPCGLCLLLMSQCPKDTSYPNIQWLQAPGGQILMDGWVDANEKLPEAWTPVQVYIPSQKPLPTVHEGFLETADNNIPFCWRIPALRTKYVLFDKNFVTAWKPFSDPPKTNDKEQA